MQDIQPQIRQVSQTTPTTQLRGRLHDLRQHM